ncbi:hypothetical protein [Blastomonas sp. CACIA14H2]|uniref:hypothetical protein n=1 Tax=Blastomonas sp. CACIA14H2 TaxID=1419876 RepID=UPI00041E23F5
MRPKPTDHMPMAADWGRGVTRRAIRLRGSPGRVDAALEDMRHAMTCTLEHDGSVVTAVTAGFHRYTLQLCPGASEPLQALVGLPLDMPVQDLFAHGRTRQNCTHMLDLAWLAMRHAARGDAEWIYSIAIPDRVSGPMRGTLSRNGAVVQDWQVEDNTIVSPAALAGQSISGGLTRWLTTESGLPDLVIEECLVLHKGFFMVGARRFAMPEGELPEGYRKAVTGVCYGYAAERIETAVGLEGMGRDFSATPEKLLTFE